MRVKIIRLENLNLHFSSKILPKELCARGLARAENTVGRAEALGAWP